MRLNRNKGLVLALLMLAVPVRAQRYTFEEVASGLKHKDASTRLRAIQILKEADYAEATEPIAAALADADDRVQLAAIDAERSLFTTRVVPRRRKIGFVVEVRTVAGGDAAAAGQLALKPRAVPPQVLTQLAVALRDDNPRVRAEAVNLASLLAPVPCARQVALAACADVGNALIDNINSRDALVRRAAMHVLGQMRYPNAVQALSDQFSYRQKGPDALAALEGLALIGHPTSVSIFEEQLTSPNDAMRRFAVEGLARIGSPDALPMLQQMGQAERSGSVLLAIHYANVKLGAGNESLQPLVAALANASQRSVVLGYLLDIAPDTAPLLAESLLKDERTDIRRLIADVLGFSGSTAVLPALAEAATDPDPDVAAAALQALERLKL
jgi:HEAT repeat protein